ncbi:hypothetical protein ACF1BU_27895 [Streptomyces sp. NPDC014724]|uniref:hypothetical protein n=1 Tax=unclassified Streptomyces TaxID=2593676 RepID=UPI0036F673FD
MNTLVTVVVVLAMIAIAAFVIHRLNARHRHQHLRPAHYDHGLAGFGEQNAPGARPAPGHDARPDTGEQRGRGESGTPGSGA